MSHNLSTEETNPVTKVAYGILIATVIALVSLVAVRLSGIENVEPGEPPVLYPRIPFVGHIIGLMTQHNNYFTTLSKRYKGPIYTLKIFSSRMYIIQSPDLAQAAFRQSKEINFNVIKNWGCRALEYDKKSTDIVAFRGEKGEATYMNELHNEMHASMTPGPNLLESNARVLNYLAKSLNDIQSTPKKQLFRWLRDEYTVGSAETLYGLRNPVSENRDFIQSVWDFDKDLGMLVLDFLPQYTAPKGHAARRALYPPFLKYYKDGLDKNSNALVKCRARVARKWGLTTEDIAKAEISIVMAAGTNAVPNAFYMICYIFSNPDLINSLRSEIDQLMTRTRRDGVQVMTLNISALQSQCPLLTACFQETLRMNKTGASVRMILEDVKLDDQYLLKKGAFVQIPSGIMHFDSSVWGPDAKEFNPRRFLAQESLPKDVKKAQGQAYIPWGGGKNLCPGRHLAFTEVVAFVAVLVYGFDLSMSDGSTMKVPKGEFQKLGIASISPEKDLDVLIQSRKGFEGVTWEFSVDSS